MHSSKGFTFVDLLVSATIVSLLGSLAAPALSKLYQQKEAEAAAQQIAQLMNTARNHAIKTGDLVTFCGVDAAGACSSHDIQKFAVFVDRNFDHTIDDNDHLSTLTELHYPGIATLQADKNKQFIVYKFDGSAQAFGAVTLCPQTGNLDYALEVRVNRPGITHVQSLEKAISQPMSDAHVGCPAA